MEISKVRCTVKGHSIELVYNFLLIVCGRILFFVEFNWVPRACEKDVNMFSPVRYQRLIKTC